MFVKRETQRFRTNFIVDVMVYKKPVCICVVFSLVLTCIILSFVQRVSQTKPDFFEEGVSLVTNVNDNMCIQIALGSDYEKTIPFQLSFTTSRTILFKDYFQYSDTFEYIETLVHGAQCGYNESSLFLNECSNQMPEGTIRGSEYLTIGDVRNRLEVFVMFKQDALERSYYKQYDKTPAYGVIGLQEGSEFGAIWRRMFVKDRKLYLAPDQQEIVKRIKHYSFELQMSEETSFCPGSPTSHSKGVPTHRGQFMGLWYDIGFDFARKNVQVPKEMYDYISLSKKIHKSNLNCLFDDKWTISDPLKSKSIYTLKDKEKTHQIASSNWRDVVLCNLHRLRKQPHGNSSYPVKQSSLPHNHHEFSVTDPYIKKSYSCMDLAEMRFSLEINPYLLFSRNMGPKDLNFDVNLSEYKNEPDGYEGEGIFDHMIEPIQSQDSFASDTRAIGQIVIGDFIFAQMSYYYDFVEQKIWFINDPHTCFESRNTKAQFDVSGSFHSIFCFILVGLWMVNCHERSRESSVAFVVFFTSFQLICLCVCLVNFNAAYSNHRVIWMLFTHSKLFVRVLETWFCLHPGSLTEHVSFYTTKWYFVFEAFLLIISNLYVLIYWFKYESMYSNTNGPRLESHSVDSFPNSYDFLDHTSSPKVVGTESSSCDSETKQRTQKLKHLLFQAMKDIKYDQTTLFQNRTLRPIYNNYRFDSVYSSFRRALFEECLFASVWMFLSFCFDSTLSLGILCIFSCFTSSVQVFRLCQTISCGSLLLYVHVLFVIRELVFCVCFNLFPLYSTSSLPTCYFTFICLIALTFTVFFSSLLAFYNIENDKLSYLSQLFYMYFKSSFSQQNIEHPLSNQEPHT